jgi:hypothetical protein
MVPKSGTRIPKSQMNLSEADFCRAIGMALQAELGGSHRAAKTVMAWTGVSSRTARLWLQGSSCPNGHHLVMLATYCRSVLVEMLSLAGHDWAVIGVDLAAIETHLTELLASVRSIRDIGR